ncbi:MAG: TRAP transporter substrate-binding protein [Alphaproteobacteria bacterium]
MFWRALLGGFASALIVGGAATATAQETVTLRIQHFLPSQAWIPASFIEEWAAKVTDESDGRIQFEIYPAMQLGGGPPDLYDQMVDGLVDIVWVLPGYTPGRFPMTEVFELPFITSNGETTAGAMWAFYENNLADEYSDAHMIAFFSHGPGILHSNTPIVALEDMDGVAVRGPTRTVNWMLEELAAEAIGMPVPQVPENLARGVVEAVVIPWEVTPSLRLTELVGNHTEFAGDESLYVATMMFAMSRAVHEALPDDLKAVIDANSGLETSRWAGRVADEGDVPGRQIAVDAGNNIITLDVAETARWKEAAQPVYDRWIEMMNDLGFDGQALVDEARSLVAAPGM